MANVGYDSLKLSSSKIVTMTISMLSIMFLSRILTLEEYGTYSQLKLIVSISTTFFMLGLPNSINYFLASSETIKEKQNFVSVYYTLTTFLGFFTGLILVISAPVIISYFNNSYLSQFIYVLAILPWTKIIMSSVSHMLIVYNKTKYLIYYRISHSLLLIGTIFLVKMLNLTFKKYILLFIILEVIFTLIIYGIIYKISGGLFVNIEKKLIYKIFNFSIPIGLATIAGTINISVDKIIIGGLFNTRELAIYTNASKELPITFIGTSITAVVLPQIVKLLNEQNKRKAIKLWNDSVIVSYVFISFLAIGVFTYATEVITLLYSQKFIAGVSVFRVYALVLLLRCTYFGMILNSKGKTKKILYGSLLGLLLNIILNFIFYYFIGYLGPAIATFLSMLFSVIYLLVASSDEVNVSIGEIFPWKHLSYITVLNISLAIFFYFIKGTIRLETFTGEVMESIILAFIWGILYFSILFNFLKRKWNSLNEY